MSTTMLCGYCKRPVQYAVMIGGSPYHAECTHGPDYGKHQPMWQIPMTTITEDDIRRIVREELEKRDDN